MDTVDYIINNSSEDNALESITRHARSIHGNDVVDSLIHNTQDEQLPEAITRLARTPKVHEDQGLMSEDNPLIKGLYGIGEKLGSIDKARSIIAGPIIQAATLGHPLDTMQKETSNIEPDTGSSFVGRLREIIPDQPPLIDSYQKDITQGENLKAASKMWLQQKFPKAYSVGTSLVATDFPGMALDEASLKLVPQIPHNPISKLSSKISGELSDMASVNREKTLIAESSLTGSKAAQEIDSLKSQKIANTLERHGLDKYMSNPLELKNAISGKEENQIINGIETPVKVQKGAIDILGEDLRLSADALNETQSKVDINSIANSIIEKLSNQYSSESSGVKFTSLDQQKLANDVNSILKVGEGLDERSFKSLIESKRNSAKYYFDMKNAPSTPVVAGPSDVTLHKAIWDEIDNYVNSKANENRDMKAFAVKNSDMSDLLNAEQMLAGARKSSLETPSLTSVAMGLGAGAGLGGAFGHPYLGMAAGGGIAAAKDAFGNLTKETIPAKLAQVQQYMANKISPITTLPSTPMNITEVQAMTPAQKNALSEYKLPRTFDEFKAQSNMVHAKLKLEMGDEAGDIAFNQMINSPQEFQDQLPLKEAALPQLFKYDRYRRVNGRIFDPILKQLAEQEILTSPASNTERMLAQNQLLKNGIYNGI